MELKKSRRPLALLFLLLEREFVPRISSANRTDGAVNWPSEMTRAMAGFTGNKLPSVAKLAREA